MKLFWALLWTGWWLVIITSGGGWSSATAQESTARSGGGSDPRWLQVVVVNTNDTNDTNTTTDGTNTTNTSLPPTIAPSEEGTVTVAVTTPSSTTSSSNAKTFAPVGSGASVAASNTTASTTTPPPVQLSPTTAPTLPPLQEQQPRECGAVLGIVTRDDVRHVGRTLLTPYLTDNDDADDDDDDDDSLLERTLDILLQSVLYDSTIVKLCASCQDHADWYFERGGGLLKFPAHHASYCQDVNGVDFRHEISMIALLPRSSLETTNTNMYDESLLPHQVKLRAFLTLPPTNVQDRQRGVPSVEFPLNFTQTNASSDLVALYWPGLVAAGSGSLALYPDYPGTGDSDGRNNNDDSNVDPDPVERSILKVTAYEQATAVSFLQLQRHVMEVTNSCTLLDMDAVTIYGVEDGAFGAVAATLVLQRFDVRSLSTFLAAGPLNLEWLLQTAVAREQNGTDSNSTANTTTTTTTTTLLDDWLRLAAYTYTNTNRNESTSSLASPAYASALSDVFGSTALSSEALASTRLPANVLDLLNADLVTLYSGYDIDNYTIPSPCNTSVWSVDTTLDNDAAIDAVCETVQSASVYPMLRSQTDRNWIYNLSVCYSDSDEIVHPRHYEDPFILSENTDIGVNEQLRDLWNRYTQPRGLDALRIETGYTHRQTLPLCAVAPVLFFVLQGHKPDDPNDYANAMTPLSADELEKCGAAPPGTTGGNEPVNDAPVAPTSSTNMAPSPSGTTNGGNMAPSGDGGDGSTGPGATPPSNSAAAEAPMASTPSNRAPSTAKSSACSIGIDILWSILMAMGMSVLWCNSWNLL
jgi:hypothetical protein